MGDSEITRDEAVRRVREVFNIFDSDGTDTCEAKEIGTLIRALGFNPNEIQVRAMLSQCEDDSNSDVILYDKFEKMMVRVMMENEITRDSEERIVQAFKTIAKGKHSINMEELAVYLTTMGDKFTQEVFQLHNFYFSPLIHKAVTTADKRRTLFIFVICFMRIYV
eukprot:TRINITY_DN1219_c0_g1_i4.p1 TRINITY_DN1219_c0_g1~~TRINITY_DN1219_c0_g1_i4.p1  ORF type:complete len:165 (-),score=26.85 TRINITY_DN1219_c0_g1_i4:360-854(-)